MMTLDPGAFVNVSITNLDLSYNRLQSLDPFVFVSINRSLSQLKIGGNPLQVSHLWSSILSPRIRLNLSELDVADIPIGRDQYFQTDLFSFHPSMKSLNLSGADLTYLPVEMIRSLPSLRELDLSRNQLSSLTDLVLNALSSLQSLRRIHLHGNPWYCDACVIGPMLKWLDISAASRHIKDGCRGLKTNAGNLTTDYNDDDGSQPCPVCRDPPAVSGVELPRLDHVNLPTCNYPPLLIDSHGLPSKVRVGLEQTTANAAAAGATQLTPINRLAVFLENPLYLALVCGLGVLVIAAVCAAVAIVARHATASYYTNEEHKRSSHSAAANNKESGDESEGLFPLKTVISSTEDGDGRSKGCIVKTGSKKYHGHLLIPGEPSSIESETSSEHQLNKNNNGKVMKSHGETSLDAPTVLISSSNHKTGNGNVSMTVTTTSRGVHCPSVDPDLP